jgi:hypothetical protein
MERQRVEFLWELVQKNDRGLPVERVSCLPFVGDAGASELTWSGGEMMVINKVSRVRTRWSDDFRELPSVHGACPMKAKFERSMKIQRLSLHKRVPGVQISIMQTTKYRRGSSRHRRLSYELQQSRVMASAIPSLLPTTRS